MNSMENTTENKYKFFALHWGQEVHRVKMSHSNPLCKVGYYLYDNNIENDHLELTPLSQITDEDAIQIGRIIYERPNAHFSLERLNDIIHITHNDSVGIVHHVCLNFKYATLNANVKISNEKEVVESFKHNIGEIHLSSRQTVGYIRVIDYLRSKGYALPYKALSVAQQIEYGWVKLKQI